ncbi:hypothetical protein M0R72_13765 [Candidatus Pacearchaeota archaeon]|jgi:hypothetical protein|nr:hypothetical protein [Candidatus Pacearchaeota archaeon]
MIDDFEISYISPDRVMVTVTGTEDVPIWFEVDGVIIPATVTATGEEQVLFYTVVDASRPMAIILHEAEEMPSPVLPSRSRWGKPLLRWQAVEGAIAYRIYHTAPGESEAKINTIASTLTTAYEIQLSKEFVDGWHFLRVESVDKYGRESTRASWVFRVFQPPESPETVTVTAQGGGVFRIAIA